MDYVVRPARNEIQTTILEAGFRIEYNIPNEVLPRELRQKNTSRDNITKLLYAGDQVVFANSSDELQQILTIYDKTLKVNISLSVASDPGKCSKWLQIDRVYA